MPSTAEIALQQANSEFIQMATESNKKRKVAEFATPLFDEIQKLMLAIEEQGRSDELGLMDTMQEIRSEILSLTRDLIRDKKLNVEMRDLLIKLTAFATEMVNDSVLDANNVQNKYITLLNEVNTKFDDALWANENRSRALGFIVVGLGLLIGIGLVIASFPLSISLISLGGILFVSGALGGLALTLAGFAIVTKKENSIKNKDELINQQLQDCRETLLNSHSLFRRRHVPDANINAIGPPPLRLSRSDF